MPSYINQSNYMSFKVLIRYIDDILKEFDQVRGSTNDYISCKLISAVEQHKIYVENMLNMLDGKIEWIPPKHTQCAFGRTYYSIDENHIGKVYGEAVLNQFKKVGEIHREFHSIAEEIMDRVQQGQNNSINTLILELAAKSRMLVEQCRKLVLSLQQN